MDKLLNNRWTVKKEREELLTTLRKIKPLREYKEDVPLEALEGLVRKIINKYEVKPQYITFNSEIASEEVVSLYNVSIIETIKYKWIGNIYGSCIYEVFVKLIIFLFDKIKKGEIKER